MLMISVSGIRGIVGRDLYPENTARYAAAFGTWAKGGRIVVGRDTRVSGPMLEEVVVAALQSVGCDVVRVGVVPTPTVAMAVLKHHAAGAVILSASHNPAEWNALKFLNAKSEFLAPEEGHEVLDIAASGSIQYVTYSELGTVTIDEDALDYHIAKILDLPYIDRDQIASRNFKVAIDAVNGAGSDSIPALLAALGVTRIETIYCTPNGLFPHNPEPLPEHLGDICELVKRTASDIGFVTDPDADRLAVVDSDGVLFGEENTQAAAIDFMLNLKPGSVATNLSSSDVCEAIASNYGQVVHRSPVGEIHVVRLMQKNRCVVGGEGNGGVINPDLHYGRDALVGIAMILQLLADRDLTSAEYRKLLPEFFISKNKVHLSETDPDRVLQQVVEKYAKYNPITIDGVKIRFDEGWVHLRKSNTEPIIRIYSEATSHEIAEALARRIMQDL
jgi:phosphomannomutase